MATAKEIACKSALVKSGLSDFALNPYGGCAHNCAYCYASFMARFSRHEQPWGRWVDVKVNVAEALVKDLRRLARRRRTEAVGFTLINIDPEVGGKSEPAEQDAPGENLTVILSSVTDAYQPLEREYGLTRACLSAIANSDAPLSVSVLTKSDLVTRDIDILRNLRDVEIGMTVTTTDDAVSRRYEPGAPPVSRRFAALHQLAEAGLRTWAFIAPVLPYHSDSPLAMSGLLRRLVDAGASRIMVDRFNPYPAGVGRFLRVAPPEAAAAMRAYTANPGEYLDNLRSVIREAAGEIGIGVRILV